MSPSGHPLTPRQRERLKALHDAQIRRRMLTYLNSSRGNAYGGLVTGRYVLELLQMSTDQNRVPSSDDHAADLLRDLVSSGYAEERDDRESPADDFRLDTWSVRVTPRGTRLLTRHEPPDLLISDYRHAAPFNQE